MSNPLFLFAAHALVAQEMASESHEDRPNPEEGIADGEAVERDRRVAELLDNKVLRNLLIQRLEDGGHVAKKLA